METEQEEIAMLAGKILLEDRDMETMARILDKLHNFAALEAQVNEQRQMIADLREENAVFVDSSRRLEAQNRQLREALNGLFARHKDGSEEQYWAEWDTALAAMEPKEKK